MSIWSAVDTENYNAELRYGEPFSVQESMGVLLEEFHELREAVHANNADEIQHEAIQVAAVAIRLAQAIERASPSFMVRSGLR